jgi:hypothetical protein
MPHVLLSVGEILFLVAAGFIQAALCGKIYPENMKSVCIDVILYCTCYLCVWELVHPLIVLPLVGVRAMSLPSQAPIFLLLTLSAAYGFIRTAVLTLPTWRRMHWSTTTALFLAYVIAFSICLIMICTTLNSDRMNQRAMRYIAVALNEHIHVTRFAVPLFGIAASMFFIRRRE